MSQHIVTCPWSGFPGYTYDAFLVSVNELIQENLNHGVKVVSITPIKHSALVVVYEDVIENGGQMMNQESVKNEIVEDMIRALLHYSFDQIQWDFNQLTEREKEIIGDQENLDKIKEYYDINSN